MIEHYLQETLRQYKRLAVLPGILESDLIAAIGFEWMLRYPSNTEEESR